MLLKSAICDQENQYLTQTASTWLSLSIIKQMNNVNKIPSGT